MAKARGPATPQEESDSARESSGLTRALGSVLCADHPAPCPRLFCRLSEQKLLVEKLTEQNSEKERTISSLRMDVQRLVRGLGMWWDVGALGRERLPPC